MKTIMPILAPESDPPPTIHLLDARAFPALARGAGIRESARALVASGRLTPVNIGSRTYYRWAELVDLMPLWARNQHANLRRGPIVTGPYRPGLRGRTVTVELATRLTALRLGVAHGALVVAHREKGHLVEVVAIPRDQIPSRWARTYAANQDARYVEVDR